MGKLSLKGFTLEAVLKFCQVLNHSEKKTNKQKAKTTERNEEALHCQRGGNSK